MKRQMLFRAALIGLALGLAPAPGAAATSPADALAVALKSPLRSPANVARDRYRHPAETLAFFGVRPDQEVVELIPGGGWYTEILAPYLAARGHYIAADSDKGLAKVRAMIAANPAVYGKAALAPFPAAPGKSVPDGSADVVLTFRNVHNWVMGEGPSPAEAFAQIYRMLKPGGTLGVVDHRLPAGAAAAREKTSGYLKVATVRKLAEAAGFRFVAASEVNANPKDKADYPDGVWTLPPTLQKKDVDRDTYLAIGESDRMTLKFVKPGK